MRRISRLTHHVDRILRNDTFLGPGEPRCAPAVGFPPRLLFRDSVKKPMRAQAATLRVPLHFVTD